MMAARRGRGGMSPTFAALTAAALAMAVSACGDDDSRVGPVGPVGPVGEEEGVPGSGDLASDVRDVAGFDRILLAGEGTVVVTPGGVESLEVETDDNLLPYIETSVEDGRLEIRTEPGIDIAPSQKISYRVGATNLAGLELSGAGSIRIGDWETDHASVLLSGVGDISIDGLAATSLEVEHVGVGTITVSGGVETQTVLAAGVGEYMGAELRSRVASVQARDTGAATVWVTDELDIVASPQGAVSYYGPADVTPAGTNETATHLGDR